jgi:nucleoside-diphosphate-sugar epimerase
MDAGMMGGVACRPTSALVTGASGFIGRLLVRWLAAAGVAVTHVRRQALPLELPGRGLVCHDLTDESAVNGWFQETQPTVVFHLAGSATAGPQELEAEHRATAVLLRAAGRAPVPPRLVLIGSAAEYGPLEGGAELAGERTVCRPTSAYGKARLAQTRMALSAAAAQPVVVARLFNIIGPGMGEHLALGRFARALANMERSGGGVLQTGSLHAIRDLVDVRDAVRVLTALACHRGALGRVVPVCSGAPVGMRAVLDDLVAVSGLDVRIQSETGAHGVNAVDRMVGDTAVLHGLGITPPGNDLRPCLQELWQAARVDRGRILDAG